ncbi:glycosyltransferase [Candidatus Flexifilum breve]|uniref:glycosyltransferase n=1 Tax=Candidatus Flexifilum breve TaxID=3140694 RepID=UPI0031CC6ABD
MSSRNPEESGQIALEALRRSGQRGVLASGWGGLKPTELPDNVHLISALPHSWLFPRMAAVVHHGGAGTTAAGFRAGVPSIIVPFGLDQPFWGSRAVAVGVGPRPIPRKQLTGARLGEAITAAVTDQGMRQQAADLGQKIRAEDGVDSAVASIERYLRSKR